MRFAAAALVAALVAGAAFSTRKWDRSGARPAPPALPSVAPPAAVAERRVDAPRAPSAPLEDGAPAWTRESPHFISRGARRFAVAVGCVRVGNAGLARVAATDRARGALLVLMQGREAGAPVSGRLAGARVTDAYESKTSGETFVRVEVESGAQRGPADGG